MKNITEPVLDPQGFAYWAKRSADAAGTLELHFILHGPNYPASTLGILFVNSFNTTNPDILHQKFRMPGSNFQGITSFLTDWQLQVMLENIFSFISGRTPHQRWALSPLLFSLYTNECNSAVVRMKLLKFADDTTVVALSQNSSDSANRQEVDQMVHRLSQSLTPIILKGKVKFF